MGTRELEGELEYELEGEYEEELEGEEFLGTIARGIGSLVGGQGEYEEEFEGEEEAEEFFRRIGRLMRRAAPILRRVARVAAPIVGTAVGGPLGGVLGRVAASALGESELELEGEYEEELEGEYEEELEGEYEEEGEEFLGTIARGIGGLLGGQGELEEEAEGEEETAPASQTEAMAELMAAVASQARTEAEAEAMMGAATVAVISARDRAALRRILPHLVRGTAILTRILRRRRITRPAVRAVPTIVRRTTRTLARRAAAGQPVTRQTAGRVMAAHTRRVLSNPRVCTRAIVRNQRATRIAARPRPVARRPVMR
ncbi:MAG TPA: hypothetical protein VGC06_29295 [Actinomycetes bacterium]